jgi:hypothetical protein
MRCANIVPVRFGIGVRSRRLGSVDSAAESLRVSLKGFGGSDGNGGAQTWLSGISPSNWIEKATQVSKMSSAQIDGLDHYVIGKLGSNEGEAVAWTLRDKWQLLRDKADTALANPPGWFSRKASEFLVFTSDFTNGYLFLKDFADSAKSAWQYLVSKGVALAGPVLRKFYDSAGRMLELNRDLSDAKTSGKFTQQELLVQKAKLDEGQASMNRARSAFSMLSAGASLDALAQGEFGTYALGEPVTAAAAASSVSPGLIIFAISLCAIAATIYFASRTVDGIPKMFGGVMENILGKGKDGATPIVSIALVASLIVAVFLLRD